MKYRVEFYMDNLYEVIDETDECIHIGSLSDCNAWLQLNDKGYI